MKLFFSHLSTGLSKNDKPMTQITAASDTIFHQPAQSGRVIL
jgi:hypothetical protein